MAKKKKNRHSHKQSNSHQTKTKTVASPTNTKPALASKVKPEQMSLSAHQHIQQYLSKNNKQRLDKNELTAVLRLSQHLRVFGLLSAAGYVNQSNEQKGEVRQRTVPVWESLLGQLINEDAPPNRRQLMEQVKEIADTQPGAYMAQWRRALTLSHHWNFWARAYAESND